MQKISDQEIEEYVASGEPMDKAGAYAIQGKASRWIPRIEGCYFNVVGLPVPLIYCMLRENVPQALEFNQVCGARSRWAREWRTVENEGYGRRLLLLLFRPLLAFFYCALEILNTFSETFAEISQLARSKDQKRNAEQQQQLGYP